VLRSLILALASIAAHRKFTPGNEDKLTQIGSEYLVAEACVAFRNGGLRLTRFLGLDYAQSPPEDCCEYQQYK
jgi:L-ribulose-5-phosphate 3-epimerase UlaE